LLFSVILREDRIIEAARRPWDYLHLNQTKTLTETVQNVVVPLLHTTRSVYKEKNEK